VDADTSCSWQLIYDRLKKQGKLDALTEIEALVLFECDGNRVSVAQTVPKKVGVVKAAFLVGEDLGF